MNNPKHSEVVELAHCIMDKSLREAKFKKERVFRLYGKVGNMKRYAPIGQNGEFVSNLIYANIYFIRTADRLDQLMKCAAAMGPAHGGCFEVREVK
jgi:hypothetical protein